MYTIAIEMVNDTIHIPNHILHLGLLNGLSSDLAALATMSDHDVARPQPQGGTALRGQQTNIVLKELGYEQTMTEHKPLTVQTGLHTNNTRHSSEKNW